jgi:hypothetical protein
MTTLNLHTPIFWDTNFSKLDKERDASFIIVRVFERGLLDDLIEILVKYETNRIKQALLEANYLTERTLHFAKAYYDLNLTDFKCYGKKQYHPFA